MRSALIACLLCAACGDTSTRLLVHINAAPGLTFATLNLSVAIGAMPARTYPVPPDGRLLRLPGTLLLRLPEVEDDVRVTLNGQLDGGGTLVDTELVRSRRGQQVEVRLALGLLDDGGAPADLLPCNPLCGYAFKRRILIENTANEVLPAGYAVEVPLKTIVGKTRADFADVRVVNSSDLVERHRIVDVDTGILHMALAAPVGSKATTNAYWLVYGNPQASAPPQDGPQVFAFYDGFDGNAVGAKWLVNGAPVVRDGAVTLRRNTLDGLTTAAGSDGLPAVSFLEMWVQVTNPASAPNASSGYHYWFGYQQMGAFDAMRPWILFIARSSGTVRAENEPCPSLTCSSLPVTQLAVAAPLSHRTRAGADPLLPRRPASPYRAERQRQRPVAHDPQLRPRERCGGGLDPGAGADRTAAGGVVGAGGVTSGAGG